MFYEYECISSGESVPEMSTATTDAASADGNHVTASPFMSVSSAQLVILGFAQVALGSRVSNLDSNCASGNCTFIFAVLGCSFFLVSGFFWRANSSGICCKNAVILLCVETHRLAHGARMQVS